MLGFAEVNVTLGNHTLEKVRMLVFKNASNPCLIGRDVLAVHPETKIQFNALMNTKNASVTINNQATLSNRANNSTTS